jgi:16S rRNA (uracil1498-N3)-methyltransferase
VQSLAKGTKLELVIQKATELGICRITPVISERSVMRIDEKRIGRKLDHWRAIAVSAATQCQRSIVPEIDSPLPLRDWLAGNAAQTNCLLLHPMAHKKLKEITLDTPECTVMVGPEGGFTDDEVNDAVACGVSTFQCGPRILRTETAGFTAISVLQSLHGDI